MANYRLLLAQVLDEIFSRKIEPYYKELMEGLGELHQYNWWKGITREIPTTEWKNAFRNKKVLPRWRYFAEGADYPETDFKTGDEVELNVQKFGLSFPISEEYMEFADRRKDLWPDLSEWIADFMEAALRTLSEQHAAPLLGAFSTDDFADGLDDEALCSTNHTGPDGNTVSNKLTRKLGTDLLNEFFELKTQFMSGEGDPISYNFDTIIMSEVQEIRWYEINNTLKEVDSSNNNANYWASRLNPVFCPWLREEVQTGASDYVFVMDSRRTPFKTLIAKPPSLRYFLMEDKDSAKVLGKMYSNVNWPYFTGIFGTDGTSSA